MEAMARERYLRISPLKLRKIVNLVRGKGVDDALYILKVLPNKGARIAYKALYSAVSNFKNRYPESARQKLKISAIYVDQAPVLRRLMPRARGRADVLRKQSSHLTVIVSTVEEKSK